MIDAFVKHVEADPGGRPTWCYEPEERQIYVRGLKVADSPEVDLVVPVDSPVVPGSHRSPRKKDGLVIVRKSAEVWKVENGKVHPDLPALSLWLTHAPEEVSEVMSLTL